MGKSLFELICESRRETGVFSHEKVNDIRLIKKSVSVVAGVKYNNLIVKNLLNDWTKITTKELSDLVAIETKVFVRHEFVSKANNWGFLVRLDAEEKIKVEMIKLLLEARGV